MNQSLQHAISFEGITYSVFDVQDSQTVHFIYKDFLERHPFKDVGEPKTILDIGAHVGIFTILAAMKFPNAHIYAVEPHPVNLKNLLLGLDFHNLTNVTVLPVAIGDGSLVDLSMEFCNSGSSCEFKQNFKNYPEDWPMLRAKALSVTLDQILVATGPMDFVKCDIEGREFTAFREFTQWEKLGSLSIELHPYHNTDCAEMAKMTSSLFEGWLRERMGSRRVHVVHPDFPDTIL